MVRSPRRPPYSPNRAALAATALMGAVLLSLSVFAQPASADSPPAVVGEIPRTGGMSLVVWDGGDVEGFNVALAGSGCRPASVWAAGPSRLVGYVFGAPTQVNAAFVGRFPSGQLPAQTPLVLVCAVETQAATAAVAPSSPAPAPAAEPPPAQTSMFDAVAEARMLALVNEERVAHGLVPLVRDAALEAVARAHSLDMQERDYFSHTNPDGESPFDRMSAAGISYGWAAENLSWAPGVDRAHRGLMESPGHRSNILNGELRRIGIGVVGPSGGQQYFTQAFTD
jgi:uncharacterized protein YkwD